MINLDLLQGAAAGYGLDIRSDLAEKLDRYAELLVEWNQKMNLTAITDPTDMVVKHFLDSLLAAGSLPEGEASLIDVGTGAGFPGVVLALYRRDVRLTLLDSLNKRLVFLKELCDQLQLPVTLIHARAEEGGKKPELREQFDVATARAVASLPVLCEYCLPFVRPEGRFIALKGPDSETEQDAAKRAMDLLGGSLRKVSVFHLAAGGCDAGERRILWIDKKTATPARFPRVSAKIAKSSL